MPTPPEAALLGATTLHAGFQVTVTALVYPRLADTSPADWSRVHARHSRVIAPLVAVVYAAVLAACGWALLDPDSSLGAAVLVACAATAVALGDTALVAAPLHGRLGRSPDTGPDPRLLARLLLADRVRAVAAALAAAAAVVAALGPPVG